MKGLAETKCPNKAAAIQLAAVLTNYPHLSADGLCT